MSLAITRRDGGSGERSRLEIFHRDLSRGSCRLSANFLTLFISHRGAKIHSVVIIYYHRAAVAAAAVARAARASLSNRERVASNNRQQ